MAVLSGQAGPSMAACDLLESEGLKIDGFTRNTQEKINDLLPPLALRTNPVDMGPAWYDSSAMQEIIRAVMDDENVSGILLLMMFASANVDVLKGVRDILVKWAQQKPVISCILSPPGIWDEEINELEKVRAIVNYPTPERAAMAMVNLWRYKRIKETMKLN
jgi:acyl-CoA synthetase (NDP forming)